DTIGHYACLWQIVMRYPQSGRGWAELANSLAERREWAHCRTAVLRVLGFAGRPDRATAGAALTALAVLVRQGRIGDLAWRTWLDILPPALQRHPQAAWLLLACGEIDRGAALLPSLTELKHPTADDCIAAANIAWDREEWERAYQYWRRAFATDLPRALRLTVI